MNSLVLNITIWAMFNNLIIFVSDQDYLLMVLSVIILILTFLLLISGSAALFRKGRVQTGINAGS